MFKIHSDFIRIEFKNRCNLFILKDYQKYIVYLIYNYATVNETRCLFNPPNLYGYDGGLIDDIGLIKIINLIPKLPLINHNNRKRLIINNDLTSFKFKKTR